MKKIIISIALVFIANLMFAEGNNKTEIISFKVLSFKVVDANNESIAGAEILINGMGIASYTDIEGNYSVKIPFNSEEEIKISFISFKDKIVKINDIKNGSIQLLEE